MEGSATKSVKLVAEITLVLILFHDAAEVRPREIDSDRAFYALLLIGFPLTILLGYVIARDLFPDLPVMMALLLAAALAPTDAGLGAPTVLNPVVPNRVRRALNVESGLNDGLATPVVLFAIAAIAGEEGLVPPDLSCGRPGRTGPRRGRGGHRGGVGGALLGWSRRRGMSTAASRALGVLMIPLLAYGAALLVSGNGFVAAWSRGRPSPDRRRGSTARTLHCSAPSRSRPPGLRGLAGARPGGRSPGVAGGRVAPAAVRGRGPHPRAVCPWPCACSAPGFEFRRLPSSGGPVPADWPQSCSR